MKALALLLILQTETLQYKGETVEIIRDRWGIPHIFADTPAGCYYAEGWCEAHDRLTQMDTWRRASRGRLAEIRGDERSVAADIQARIHGYTQQEYDAMFAGMSARAQTALTAYVDGVNAAIKKRGADVEPWTVADSLSIIVMMARRFGASGEIETRVPDLLNLLEKKHGAETARRIFDDLVRYDDAAAATTLHDHATAPEEPRKQNWRPPSLDEYNRKIEEAVAHWHSLGVPTGMGSNAWVISAGRTRTGNAMLYGGPMMGQACPSICNEFSLSNREFTAAGMSFPGLPGILIGFNTRLAWTTTSGAGDNTDMFLLELNPENPRQYKNRGRWVDLETREEQIKIKGRDPHKEIVYRSLYGPVVTIDRNKNTAYARRSAHWMLDGQTCEAFLSFSHATNIKEFQAACEKIASSHNLFYADVEGNIGFWFCGRFPVRAKDHDPRFPPRGDGSQDWLSFLPFQNQPQSVNPARGYFTNWNNRPSRRWSPFYQGRIFWGKKMEDELAGDASVTFEKVWEISKTTAYHAYTADYFKPFVLDATARSADAKIRKANELLAKWDNMNREDSPAAALWAVFEDKVLRRAFRDVLPPETWLAGRQVYRFLGDVLLYQLEGDRAITRLRHKYLDDPAAVINEALKEAIEQLEKKETDWSRWTWKDETIKLDAAGEFKSQRGRGTYMIAVELAKDGPRAVSCWAPGVSEDPNSPHYKDLLELYAGWKNKPVLYRKDQLK